MPVSITESNSLVLTYAFIFGLILGSFYTATASRILYYFYGPGRKTKQRWKYFFTRPSFCMQCETRIPFYALIPLAGYFVSLGRCTSCKEPIGIITLLGEIFPAFLLPLLVYTGTPPLAALFSVLVALHLYISIVTDYNFYQLDHENALFIALWGILAVYFSRGDTMENFTISGITSAGTFSILTLLSIFAGKGKLGQGDIILGTILAFFAGFPWVLVLFNMAASLAVVYSFLIIRNRHVPIPFGVFLAIGTWVTILWKHVYYLII